LSIRAGVDQNGGVKYLPFVSALLVLAFLIPSQAVAAGKSKKKSTPIPVDTSDRITAVHLTSITINLFATHAGKEYKVTPATKITVNGQPSQLSGLATGMDVVVAPAADGITAATVDATTPKR
jgi:hypothetical protein